MEYRIAEKSDLPLLADLNRQLIEDEAHANAMSVAELERRMRGWIARTYTAVLFTKATGVVGYALYRTDNNGVFLRQFFICRDQRRRGLGREAMELLSRRVWPAGALVTLEALAANEAGLAFWRALGFEDYAVTLRRWLVE